MEIITNSPGQTKKLGRILAKQASGIKCRKNALIIGLEGDLGSGKTTFLQGFAAGLGIKEKILSPTFIILKKFKAVKAKKQELKAEARWFYHVDCYRIKRAKEILELGFKEITSDPQNIIAIEWFNRVKKILPRNYLILKFQIVNKNSRKIWLSKKRN